MTAAEYNLFTSDLFDRVTAGTLDPRSLVDPVTGAVKSAQAVIDTPEAQAVLRYFFVKLVDPAGPPVPGRPMPALPPKLHGPVPSLRLLRVLMGIGAGLGNKAIAAELGWSHEAVKSAVTRLFLRTGCKNRWDLGLWVRDHSAWMEREVHAAEVLESSNVNGVVFSDQLPSSDNMSTFPSQLS